MSQNDYVIEDALFPAYHADLNLALKALASMNEGPTEPTTMYASQVWVDTTANILKLRNKTNTAWISVADIDYTNDRVEFVANIYHAASTSGYTFKSSGGATLLTLSNTGVLALGGKLDTNAHIIRESVGTAQASASTVTPPTDGNIFHITGTTTVAGFTNGSVGQRYTVIPDGVFTITNSSTLIIEGGADYTTVAGTSFEIIQDTATVWRVKVPPVVDVSPVKAWVNFNGTGTVAINSSFNVSSITDNGVGDYTINFTTAMADTNYAVLIGNTAAFANRQVVVLGSSTGTPTLKSTTQLRVIVEVAGTRIDLDDISVGIMGN